MGINLLGVTDLKCNNTPEGEIRVEGIGGYQPYMFSATGNDFVATDTLTGLLAGDYWVKIKDGAGCLDSVFASIRQPLPLTVNAVPSDTTINLGFQVQTNTVTTPFGRPVAFEWMPPLGLSCTDCKEPLLTGIQSQDYIVKITDSTGCVAYDTVRLRVLIDRPIYAPNIFTPEKDYPNDHFTLFGGPAAANITLLRIYDRWGELVFETKDIPLNDPNLGWNGIFRDKKVDGVFTYYAYIQFVDDAEVRFDGSVTVIR